MEMENMMSVNSASQQEEFFSQKDGSLQESPKAARKYCKIEDQRRICMLKLVRI